jgi:hypothetical protein
MNFGWSILIMLFDGVLYGLLGWYVKKIFPGRYGASEPWYFIFTPKFWSTTVVARAFLPSTHPHHHLNSEYFKDRSFKDKRAFKCRLFGGEL